MLRSENESRLVNVLFGRLNVSLCRGLQHPASQEFNSPKLETSFALISYPVNDEASVQCKTGKSEVPLSGLIHMYTHLQTQAVTRTPKQQVVIELLPQIHVGQSEA